MFKLRFNNCGILAVQLELVEKFQKSSDVCTTILDNFDDNFHFLSFHWFKTIEREK